MHRFHFNSLAHDNGAVSSTVESAQALASSAPEAAAASRTPTPTPWICSGTQLVPKFGKEGETARHRVRILVALWRLRPTKDVDLVLSCNIPLTAEGQAPPESARANAAQEQQQPQVDLAREEAEMTEVFKRAAQSLRIEDWGLFQ